MKGERKTNYGYSFDVIYTEKSKFFDFIVFNVNNIDMYYNRIDFENILKLLNENSWNKVEEKKYGDETEIIFEKNKMKLMFYI